MCINCFIVLAHYFCTSGLDFRRPQPFSPIDSLSPCDMYQYCVIVVHPQVCCVGSVGMTVE